MTGIPCVHVVRVGRHPNGASMYSLLEECYFQGRQQVLLRQFIPAVAMHEDPAENLFDQDLAGWERLPKPKPPRFKSGS